MHQVIIEGRAHLNIQDEFVNSALSVAAQHGHIECVLGLLEAGATVDILDIGGSSPTALGGAL